MVLGDVLAGAKFCGTVSQPGADFCESLFLDEDRSAGASTHDSPRKVYLIAIRVRNEVLEVDSDAAHHSRRLRGVLHRQCSNVCASVTTVQTSDLLGPHDFSSRFTGE